MLEYNLKQPLNQGIIMGQAKQRGTKEQRITQSIERNKKQMENRVFSISEYHNETDISKITACYDKHTPIVNCTLIDVYNFIKDNQADVLTFVDATELSLEDIHDIFNGNLDIDFKAFITPLFWYFLYKNKDNLIYSAVSYDGNHDCYILLNDDNQGYTNQCGFGIDFGYLPCLYKYIEQSLTQKINPPDTPDNFKDNDFVMFFHAYNDFMEMFDNATGIAKPEFSKKLYDLYDLAENS